jgi:peptidoglycan/xylan/chitin deacetylase (PgdA/CDA1 family)
MGMPPPLSLLAPAGPSARLNVLIFHRVHPVPDPLFPDEPHAAWFDRLLRHIRRWFNVLPLDEAIGLLEQRTLPARSLCITFDDGYADNWRVAAPILGRHRLPATFFVATGFLDGGRMFNDSVIEAIRACPAPVLDLSAQGLGVHSLTTVAERRIAVGKLLEAVKYQPQHQRDMSVRAVAESVGAALPDDLMMTRDEVRLLARSGMAIGGHTRTHPILAQATSDAARAEIADGRSEMEDITGAAVRLFAYPNGRPGKDYGAEHVALVRELGFAGAVSTAWGTAASGCDVFQIPRFTPWDKGFFRFGLRLAANAMRRGYDTV